MNAMLFLIPVAVIALLALPFAHKYNKLVSGKEMKLRMVCNICMFVGICAIGVALPMGSAVTALAADAALVGTAAHGWGFIAAALATGLACIGSGVAVAAAAPAGIGAVSEDPKSFGKAIIFVVLGEGIAIYGLLISILIINKL